MHFSTERKSNAGALVRAVKFHIRVIGPLKRIDPKIPAS